MPDPRVSDIYSRARAHHKAGRLEEARADYERVLAQLPKHPATLQFLGLIAHQQDDNERAVALIGEAIRLEKPQALFQNNLGISLRALKRYDEAETAFRRALEIRPNYAGALYNLAMLLLARIDVGDDPADKNSVLDEAEGLVRGALGVKPEFVDAIIGLATVQIDRGQIAEAEATLRKALELDPDSPDAACHLGALKQQYGRLDEAVELYRSVLRQDPDHELSLMYLGSALHSLGANKAAGACFKRLVRSKPDAAGAWINLASIEDDANHYQNALEAYRYAAQVNPDCRARVACHLALLFLKACDWKLYAERESELTRLVEEHLDSEALEDVTPLSLNYFGIPTELRRKAAAHRASTAEKTVEVSARRCEFSHERRPVERLRVGYVSPDFRTHAVGTLLRDMFRHHDRSGFEILAYSLVPAEDEVTAAVREGVDRFIDISGCSAEVAARRVFDDEVHLLIDLAGYTSHSNTELFALRPAPVQGHYLGYLDTMGADFLPYLIADEQTVTPEMEASFSESVIYLPVPFFVTSEMPTSERAFERREEGLPDNGFVFCCMNNQRKINPEVFDAWMRILAGVPGSVLWLHDRDDVGAADNLRAAAGERGVDPDRLIMAGAASHTDYLARYVLADLFVDTFVYSAGATGVGALSAGIPMLTRPGGTMLNRMGSSLVMGAGLSELVAEDTEAYVRKAIELGNDREATEALKRRLRTNRSSVPLFDTQRWVRNFEKGLRLMWEDFETGRGPQSHRV